MTRILITGSNGQLGKCIIETALQYSNFKLITTTSKELDITNPKRLNSVFQSGNFDYCINCAAYTDVEQAEKEPEKAFLVNSEGVRNIAETCKKHNVLLVHVSTDYVFDGEQKGPYTSADRPNPINQYGKSKLQGEEHILSILTAFYIIRTSWLYSSYGKNFYKTILEKAKTEQVLYITDRQIGCPTNANNLALFILDTLFKGEKPFGTYHFTDGNVMTWFDFAEKILIENGLENSVDLKKTKNYRTLAARPKNSVLK